MNLTQRTPSQSDNSTVYAIFTTDGENTTQTSALQDQIYTNLADAQVALTKLKKELPYSLRNKVVILEVPQPTTFDPNTDLRWYVTLD